MTRVRIGLVRHFEVSKPMPSGWITSQELAQWREDYERAEVVPTAVELGDILWNRCLTSDLRRAYLTAEAIYAGPIQRMKELREVQTVQLRTGRLRLPFQGWRWLLRLAWMTSHPSQRTAKTDFLGRVRSLVDEVLSRASGNILIVSHAGMMVFLKKELLRLGYTGSGFRFPQSAKLYLFERTVDLARGQTAPSGGPRQAAPVEVEP